MYKSKCPFYINKTNMFLVNCMNVKNITINENIITRLYFYSIKDPRTKIVFRTMNETSFRLN